MAVASTKTVRRRRAALRWWRILLILAIVLIALAFLLGLWFIKEKLDKVRYNDGGLLTAVEGEIRSIWDREEPLDLTGLEETEDVAVADGEIYKDKNVLNILLLGTDRPYGPEDPGRADSIMILSLDFKNSAASLVSVERGMGAPILSGPYEGQWDWITHLYHYGGANMVMDSVSWCFKLDVSRYAQVDFDAFTAVVDALGGVDIELTESEAYAMKTLMKLDQELHAGVNHLDGRSALAYARTRKIDSDWVRVTRQRNVIQALLHKLRDADLATLNQAADAVLPYVETNFTQLELLSLLTRCSGFLGADLRQMTVPAEGTYGGMTVMGGRGAFAPDFERNTRILREFLYGTAGE